MKKRLGNFDLLEQIDPGGATTVYRALENMGQGITRPVAIKVLQSWNRDDEKQMATLRREVEVLVELESCPNIVSIHGFGIDEEAGAWIALELAGRSLKHFIGDEPADPEQVRVMLRDVLRGLVVVHGREPPILHRDLKPSNILSTAYGLWKVADFGLAKRRGADETLNLVTVQYAAPELMDTTLGAESPRMDLYSLGMTAYEYALGRRLYRKQFPSVYDPLAGMGEEHGDERPKWMYWHTSQQMTVPPLSQLIEGYPQDLSDLIAALTAKPVEARIPSAAKALSRLGSVEGTALPVEAAPVDEEQVPRRKVSPALVLAVAVLVLVLGAVGLLYLQADARPVIVLDADGHFTGQAEEVAVTGRFERFPAAGRATVKMGNDVKNVLVEPDGRFRCMVPVKSLKKQDARLILKDGAREFVEDLTIERLAPASVALSVKTNPAVPRVQVVVTDEQGQRHSLLTRDDGVARFEDCPYGAFEIAFAHPRYKPKGYPPLEDESPSLYVLPRKQDTGIDREREFELRLAELSPQELFGKTMARMQRALDLARKKSNCPPGPLSTAEAEELRSCLEELRELSDDYPQVNGFLADLERVEECKPASLAATTGLPKIEPPEEPRVASAGDTPGRQGGRSPSEEGGVLTDLAEVARRAGAEIGDLEGLTNLTEVAGRAVGGDFSELVKQGPRVDPAVQARLMAMSLKELQTFVEANVPPYGVRVEAVPELDRVRVHGAVFDDDELAALALRLAAAMPRLQPELRVDGWAVCRGLEQRLEDMGAEGVRVHAILRPFEPRLYVLCKQADPFDARAATEVARKYVLNEDLLRVAAYLEPEEAARQE